MLRAAYYNDYYYNNYDNYSLLLFRALGNFCPP